MATETKHKLGPLTCNNDAVNGTRARPYLIADTSNGRATYWCGVAFGKPTGGQGWPYMDKDGNFNLDDAVAYAQLFAAAPRLLSALESLLEFADAGTPIHPSAHIWDDARAALSAARGGAR